jgi:hypothetical protein
MNKLPQLYRKSPLGGWIIDGRWRPIIFRNSTKTELNSDDYILRTAGIRRELTESYVDTAVFEGNVKIGVVLDWPNLTYVEVWLSRNIKDEHKKMLIAVLKKMNQEKRIRVAAYIFKNLKWKKTIYYNTLEHFFLKLYTDRIM